MPRKKDYSAWSKEELIKRVHALEARKKYGLVWDEEHTPEEFEKEAKDALPILKQVQDKTIHSSPDDPTHILIEGDNYHALSVLNYTHEKAVDVIYIDPPYNTGNNTWKYNNRYVNDDDGYKHSKWLSFMDKRLRLARNLLSPDGIICVTIDNYEVHTLRLLMEEIFLERDIIMTVIEHNFRGRVKNNFALTHEYALWGVPKDQDLITRQREKSDDILRNLRRTGQGSRRHESPTMFFGVEVNKENLEIVGVTHSLKLDEAIPKHNNPKTEIIYPIDDEGVERRWYFGRATTLKESREGTVWAKRIKGKIQIHYRKAGQEKRRKSVWTNPKFDGSTYGTELLTSIIGQNDFPFPKSLYAVKECIEACTYKKDAVIVDFFAGSGTTGHAVLELNKEDEGQRQVILCTNNENNICIDITYPRVKRVIKGYKSTDGKKIPALGGNLNYYRTAFVPAAPTDANKEMLTQRSVEMLCLRENTFEFVRENSVWKLYKNQSHYTAILFDNLAIPKFKKELAKLEMPIRAYIFSLGDETFEDEFEDMADRVSVRPIPEAILRVYRRIYQ